MSINGDLQPWDQSELYTYTDISLEKKLLLGTSEIAGNAEST